MYPMVRGRAGLNCEKVRSVDLRSESTMPRIIVLVKVHQNFVVDDRLVRSRAGVFCQFHHERLLSDPIRV